MCISCVSMQYFLYSILIHLGCLFYRPVTPIKPSCKGHWPDWPLCTLPECWARSAAASWRHFVKPWQPEMEKNLWNLETSIPQDSQDHVWKFSSELFLPIVNMGAAIRYGRWTLMNQPTIGRSELGTGTTVPHPSFGTKVEKREAEYGAATVAVQATVAASSGLLKSERPRTLSLCITSFMCSMSHMLYVPQINPNDDKLCMSIYLSVCLSACLSIYRSIDLTISFLSYLIWSHLIYLIYLIYLIHLIYPIYPI